MSHLLARCSSGLLLSSGLFMSAAGPALAQSDLQITKDLASWSPLVVDEGDQISFNVFVSRTGPPATGVQISDPLPAGLTYVSHGATSGTYDPGTGVWDLGTHDTVQDQELVLTATVNAGTGGTVITNTASLLALDQLDTDPSNDKSSRSVTVLEAATVPTLSPWALGLLTSLVAGVSSVVVRSSISTHSSGRS